MTSVRPDQIDLSYYPGQTITLTLTFPDGFLATRTFKAFLGGRVAPGVELTCTEDDDTLTVTADPADTLAFGHPVEFHLLPFTAPSTYAAPMFTGLWSPGTNDGTPSAASLLVVVEDIEVTVEAITVSGIDSPTYTDLGDAADAIDIAFAAGEAYRDILLTEDTEITLTGLTAGVPSSIVLDVYQDATGGWEITWPAGTLAPNGNQPVIATGPDQRTKLTVVSQDGVGVEVLVIGVNLQPFA